MSDLAQNLYLLLINFTKKYILNNPSLSTLCACVLCKDALVSSEGLAFEALGLFWRPMISYSYCPNILWLPLL